MQIAICLLVLLASLAHTQRPPTHYILTDFENFNGQFRQQFFDPYGNAHGVYSYVNPSGQLVRVQYSTGAQPPAPVPQPFSGPILRYVTTPSNEIYNPGGNVTTPPTKLFTPAVVQYPTATAGQLENYRKALEQYANEIKS